MDGIEHYKSTKDFDNYINILEENGIVDARTKLENMYILDYLIINDDRHLNNFGIVRDVNTLKWLDVAPIFDSGKALNISMFEDEITNDNGKLFYEEKNFDELIKIVNNPKRIDIEKLNGIDKDFENLLREYKNIAHISDKKISRLCSELNRRIEKYKEIIKKCNYVAKK